MATENVHVLVGTKKGAFIYSSDEARERWSISDPNLPGWTVNHMAVDNRGDTPRLFAAGAHWAWGPFVGHSDDLGKTWDTRSPGLGFKQDDPSAAFTGKSRLERQRLVNRALGDIPGNRVHALAIRAFAPNEAGGGGA